MFIHCNGQASLVAKGAGAVQLASNSTLHLQSCNIDMLQASWDAGADASQAKQAAGSAAVIISSSTVRLPCPVRPHTLCIVICEHRWLPRQ